MVFGPSAVGCNHEFQNAGVNERIGQPLSIKEKIQSIWNTIMLWFEPNLELGVPNWINDLKKDEQQGEKDFKAEKEGMIREFELCNKPVSVLSSQAGGGITSQYLSNKVKNKECEYFTGFAMHTLKQVREKDEKAKVEREKNIEDGKKSIKKLLNKFLGKPVFIPFALEKQELFGMQHVVLITVIGDKVEFYDPRGIHSEHYSVGDKTLREFIKEITGKENIIQNSQRNQMDINNCGVFVMNRMKELMDGEKDIGKFEVGTYSTHDIKTMREHILDTISRA